MKSSQLHIVPVYIFLILSLSKGLFAQDYHNFVQFYLNPSLINPSFIGSDGRTALYVSYKKQWAGLEGAPTFANVNIQGALQNRVSLGLNLNREERGLINTSSFLVTGGYTIPLQDASMFRFGFSLGAASNQVDVNALNFGSPGDPIQVDLLDNNIQLLGNAGFSYHSRSFHLGVSIPNILQPVFLSNDAFSVAKTDPFESVIFHTSYRIYFGNGQNVFEPYLLYRKNNTLPSQLEAAGVLHFQHKVWVGGSYKQDFGISGLGGFKVSDQLAVGYSYTIKNTGINELGRPSHEIQLAVLFGERKKDLPVYSFIDTKISEGKHKDYKQLVAGQKKKENELAKKHAADLEKKKSLTKKNQEFDQIDTEKQENVLNGVAKSPDPVVSEPGAIHNAGPRVRQQLDLLNNPVVHDQAQDEKERIERLEIHANDATEFHNEDHHPNAERHEIVKRGSHSSELASGDYVIAGVFSSRENALHFSEGLVKLRFQQADYGYLTEKGFWYVYISVSSDINQARSDRDKYRKMKIFKDAWLLTVHH